MLRNEENQDKTKDTPDAERRLSTHLWEGLSNGYLASVKSIKCDYHRFLLLMIVSLTITLGLLTFQNAVLEVIVIFAVMWLFALVLSLPGKK